MIGNLDQIGANFESVFEVAGGAVGIAHPLPGAGERQQIFRVMGIQGDAALEPSDGLRAVGFPITFTLQAKASIIIAQLESGPGIARCKFGSRFQVTQQVGVDVLGGHRLIQVVGFP